MNNKTRSFNPIKKPKRAFEEVALIIKESIFSGTYKPGQKLPSEVELAHQFGVSRHTIREALRTLEIAGFLTIRTGVSGGPIVKDTIVTTISNLFMDVFQMEKITVKEFTAARLAIEKVILNDAINNFTEEDIKNLKENIAQAKALIAKKEIATEANFEFHSLLARASKNKVFIILEKTMNAIMYELRSRTAVDFKTTKGAVEAHEKLLEALVKKDWENAVMLLEKHLLAVGKSFGPSSNKIPTQ